MTADVTADASSTSLTRSVLVARYPQPSGRPPPSSICTAPLLPEFTPCAPRTQRHTREYTCKISLKCYGGSCAPHHTPLHPTLPRSLRRAAPVQKPAVALVKPDRTALIDIYQAQYTLLEAPVLGSAQSALCRATRAGGQARYGRVASGRKASTDVKKLWYKFSRMAVALEKYMF